MDKVLDKLVDGGVDFGLKLIGFIFILVVGFYIVRLLIRLLKKGRGFARLEKSVQTFIISFLNITLKCVVLVTALANIGIPMTSLITVLGTASLAIGLAMQGGLTNMVGGLTILIFKPFKVGDWIESNGSSGSVEEITIFHTVLKSLDCTKIVLPNGELANSNIKNFTYNSKRRLCLDFSVSYDSDIDKVKQVIKEVIDKEELVLKDEEVFIRLTNHADSALIFTVRVWTLNENFWPLKFNLLENVKKAFDKNKIQIPYPQVDVHLDKKEK
ncbi:MAG: mechanosensitive ion channel [Bacilli bacterium]|nr:mechanosensitive ion channel [Bacilli bacterium]